MPFARKNKGLFASGFDSRRVHFNEEETASEQQQKLDEESKDDTETTYDNVFMWSDGNLIVNLELLAEGLFSSESRQGIDGNNSNQELDAEANDNLMTTENCGAM